MITKIKLALFAIIITFVSCSKETNSARIIDENAISSRLNFLNANDRIERIATTTNLTGKITGDDEHITIVIVEWGDE